MARLDYFAPGVYIEEIDRGSRPIEGVSTAISLGLLVLPKMCVVGLSYSSRRSLLIGHNI
ncbi:hypothetical protein LC613_32130 [Nostoc sphaeroides CHAB 2801]|uniref:hypothetical protein n=1 Tax=Nostoc sphaeroides TaxID=446679 RepID=UPI001E4158D0|nr:hypothetical protein [Nostoc sphaeroides]MCC5632288.1 hypothetical protein [Nostoc sphaeroides CHAB 2801]